MPTHQRLGSDDGEDRKDRWKPAVQLDEEPAIIIREPDTAMQSTPQDNQLMSKRRVLGFKPQLRLERRGQHGQNETEQPDHSANLGDSFTASNRTRFSVHTAPVHGAAMHMAGYDWKFTLSLGSSLALAAGAICVLLFAM
jgi:hypothetical protein